MRANPQQPHPRILWIIGSPGWFVGAAKFLTVTLVLLPRFYPRGMARKTLLRAGRQNHPLALSNWVP